MSQYLLVESKDPLNGGTYSFELAAGSAGLKRRATMDTQKKEEEDAWEAE